MIHLSSTIAPANLIQPDSLHNNDSSIVSFFCSETPRTSQNLRHYRKKLEKADWTSYGILHQTKLRRSMKQELLDQNRSDWWVCGWTCHRQTDKAISSLAMHFAYVQGGNCSKPIGSNGYSLVLKIWRPPAAICRRGMGCSGFFKKKKFPNFRFSVTLYFP